MAHFYGTLKGSRGRTSRLGTKSSGLVARVASWEGAVEVALYEVDGVDFASVYLRPHEGAGMTRLLYEGTVSGIEQAKKEVA